MQINGIKMNHLKNPAKNVRTTPRLIPTVKIDKPRYQLSNLSIKGG